ncbi:hypothetical protein FHG87_015359 [Trinorchestia longiramus]|nr:hypothetical protein FHG87_015359 [Trinorchestia longiramus]
MSIIAVILLYNSAENSLRHPTTEFSTHHSPASTDRIHIAHSTQEPPVNRSVSLAVIRLSTRRIHDTRLYLTDDLTKQRLLEQCVVRSALVYPVIPLYTLTPTSISKLRVQNKATRFITNAEWHNFNTSAQLHRQTKLPRTSTLFYMNTRRGSGITLKTCTHICTNTSHFHTKLDTYHTELSQARKQKYSAPSDTQIHMTPT